MNYIDKILEVQDGREKLVKTNKSRIATVVETSDVGVKIKIYGEDVERDTYYNSLVNVNVGDKVFIDYYSGSIVIIGKFLY